MTIQTHVGKVVDRKGALLRKVTKTTVVSDEYLTWTGVRLHIADERLVSAR